MIGFLEEKLFLWKKRNVVKGMENLFLGKRECYGGNEIFLFFYLEKD